MRPGLKSTIWAASKLRSGGPRWKWAWPAVLKNPRSENLSIDPRNPLKPRARNPDLGQKHPFSGPAAHFKKTRLLKTRRSGPGQTLRWPQEKSGQRGDPSRGFFITVFHGGPQTPANTGGYCTSVAAEMSCVMQIRVCVSEMGRS